MSNERNSWVNAEKHERILFNGRRKKKTIIQKRMELMGEREDQTKSQFNKEKWLLLCREAPFRISHRCCDIMKKRPLKKYEKEHDLKPILATMAEESRLRKQQWIRHGCNAFDGVKQSSQPMSFWTEQDVLEYVLKERIEIASVYGAVRTYGPDGKEVLPLGNIGYFKTDSDDYVPNMDGCTRKCDQCQRTGCIFCAFGLHLEKGETRFQRLAQTHPRQYEYCIKGGQWVDNLDYEPTDSGQPDSMGWINWNPKKIWVPSKEGLGMGYVFDFINQLYGKDMMKYE